MPMLERIAEQRKYKTQKAGVRLAKVVSSKSYEVDLY
jgi:hypothetical protein